VAQVLPGTLSQAARKIRLRFMSINMKPLVWDNSPQRMSPAITIIRLLVGWVFLVEGILKFVLPDELGVGRFLSIGIPAPRIMGPFVGVVEVACGALVLVGLFTRLASIALLIDITVAILSTKIPIWLGRGYWRFTLPKLKHYGFLSMLHEARTDFSMVLGLIFLLIVGAGAWSFDIKIPRSNTDLPASDTSRGTDE
jgi:putative oxidoreductase